MLINLPKVTLSKWQLLFFATHPVFLARRTPVVWVGYMPTLHPQILGDKDLNPSCLWHSPSWYVLSQPPLAMWPSSDQRGLGRNPLGGFWESFSSVIRGKHIFWLPSSFFLLGMIVWQCHPCGWGSHFATTRQRAQGRTSLCWGWRTGKCKASWALRTLLNCGDKPGFTSLSSSCYVIFHIKCPDCCHKFVRFSQTYSCLYVNCYGNRSGFWTQEACFCFGLIGCYSVPLNSVCFSTSRPQPWLHIHSCYAWLRNKGKM